MWKIDLWLDQGNGDVEIVSALLGDDEAAARETFMQLQAELNAGGSGHVLVGTDVTVKIPLVRHAALYFA